ncbi:conserved hypothetical protein [Azospirillaceae bacterium]
MQSSSDNALLPLAAKKPTVLERKRDDCDRSMEISDAIHIPAPPPQVWAALNTPEILKHCIPGCETIEKISETEFQAIAVVKVGPIRTKFSGRLYLNDIAPPRHYRLTGQGEGGVAGFAKGAADVQLFETEEGNAVLSYTVQAQVGGRLAQLGARLIDAAARSMATMFFERFAEILLNNPPIRAEETIAPLPIAST